MSDAPNLTDKIDSVIAMLEAAKADSQKVDSGKAGDPGTRVRKMAMAVKGEMDAVRKMVIEARNAK